MLKIRYNLVIKMQCLSMNCWFATIVIFIWTSNSSNLAVAYLPGICEKSDVSSNNTLYSACITEAQQLFRSRNVIKELRVFPENSTCGAPPLHYCMLVRKNANDFFI